MIRGKLGKPRTGTTSKGLPERKVKQPSKTIRGTKAPNRSNKGNSLADEIASLTELD